MYILSPLQTYFVLPWLCGLTVEVGKGGEDSTHGMPPYATFALSIDHIDWQWERWGGGKKKTPGECPQHLPPKCPHIPPHTLPSRLEVQRLRQGGCKESAWAFFPISPTAPLGCFFARERCTPVYIHLIPSSKTPLVEGYVTMMAARSLLCFSTWWNKINFHTPSFFFRY